MNRIEKRFSQLNEKNEKAFITYTVAGLPDMEGTKAILRKQFEAGVDVVELGIPFSDPVADGPVIQDASYKAILKGVNLVKIFDMVEELRQDCEIPLVFMMYYNTVLHYGVDKFVEKCKTVGVDGLVIPDLPYEEQGELQASIDKTEGAPILIQLVAPVSKQRIPMLLEKAKGFVYCVSSMGVTGQKADFHKDVVKYLEEVKSISKVPVMMGFGVREAKDVEPFKNIIDGTIVGSHFINLMEENNYDPLVAGEYVSTFKKELNK